MPKISLLLITFVLTACSGMPQTREGFIDAVSNGAWMTDVSTHVATRSFEEVNETLEKKSRECLGFDIVHTRQSGYVVSAFAVKYRSSFEVLTKNKAELTIRNLTKGTIGPKMPQGGYYAVAVDVERISKNKTKLTFYGPEGWSLYQAIEQWSDGNNAPCPNG